MQRLEEGRSTRPTVNPREGRPEGYGQEEASMARAIDGRVLGSRFSSVRSATGAGQQRFVGAAGVPQGVGGWFDGRRLPARPPFVDGGRAASAGPTDINLSVGVVQLCTALLRTPVIEVTYL